jgi:hypothetical protein
MVGLVCRVQAVNSDNTLNNIQFPLEEDKKQMHTRLLGLNSHLDRFHHKVLQQAIQQVNDSMSVEVDSTYHGETKYLDFGTH